MVTKTEKKEVEEKIMPVYKIKEGGIDGVVWENKRDGKNGEFISHSVYVEKSFTRDDGQTWEKSKGFFAQDVDNLTKVVAGIKGFFDSKGVRTSVRPRE